MSFFCPKCQKILITDEIKEIVKNRVVFFKKAKQEQFPFLLLIVSWSRYRDT